MKHRDGVLAVWYTKYAILDTDSPRQVYEYILQYDTCLYRCSIELKPDPGRSVATSNQRSTDHLDFDISCSPYGASCSLLSLLGDRTNGSSPFMVFGKAITSRTVDVSVSSATSLSNPRAKPA